MTKYENNATLKKTWYPLIIGGVLELLAGGLILFFGVFFVLFKAEQHWQILPTLILNTLSAAFLIALGLGSVRARRWARVLSLAFIYSLLLRSVCKFPSLAIVNWQLAPNYAWSFFLLSIVVALILAFGIWIYGSRNASGVCERHDPTFSWPESCPLPVLIFAVSQLPLSAPKSGYSMAFFGLKFSGAPGVALWCTFLLISLLLAFGFYKQNVLAWWGALALLLVEAFSDLITYFLISPSDYPNAYGYRMWLVIGAWSETGLYGLYLFWIKRY